eukprot:863321_1
MADKYAEMDLKLSCPDPDCVSNEDEDNIIIRHWKKASCGHYEKLNTDLNVFCPKQTSYKCKWSSGSKFHFVGDLEWKCRSCQNYRPADIHALSAALLDVASSFEENSADKATCNLIMKYMSKRIKADRRKKK